MDKIIQIDTRVQNLEYSNSFKNLTEKEKNYAYFLSKACWAGAKMVLHQLCYEAPALFLLFQCYFQEKDFFKLQSSAQVSQQEWESFIAYVGGFYGNLSNYHSFGHMKFIPDLNEQTFKKIIFSNPLYNDKKSSYQQIVDDLYPQVQKEIFQIEKPYSQLNFPYEGGVTGYFSRNMTKNDLSLISEFLQSQSIDVLNTRAFKKDDTIIISIGSINKETKDYCFKDQKFQLAYGEFSEYLKEMNLYLNEAQKYVANERQKRMYDDYIEHFQTGNIDTHKNSQREWIKDLGPVVETNIGWIETYIDPQNTRAYFEGWVAIVDKEKSKKFQNLVKNSEQIIPKLPWDKSLEKDKFLAPEFVTLDVICFATNGCPLGINIPNYDDIRENEGFKNVFLSNSVGSYTINSVQFATKEQSKLLSENIVKCYEVHVACHELLGHGVGKLIYRQENMQQFIDPITQESFECCYEQNETWNSKFGKISTSYEECRADTCGFYLCTLPEVYEVFGLTEDYVQTLLWVNVMQQLRKGILGLTLYNPETKKWGQAHTQGAFVFSMFLYKNQKTDIVHFTKEDNDFLIHLNQENLMKEGQELIKQLLITLQVYKSSGNIQKGGEFYSKYSQVDDYFIEIRNIIISQKKPRRVELNNNLVRYNENLIEPIVYPESFEGIIMSYADRFQFNQQLYDQVKNEWDQYKEYLKI